MVDYVGLLRAVNVGGTGKLPMSDLVALCTGAGFGAVRTYIASGNVLFRSDATEREVKSALEERLRAYAGKPVGVLVRTRSEMASVASANPFVDAPPSQVMVIFLDEAVTLHTLEGVTGQTGSETIEPGGRELYVHFAGGQARSRLRIPAAIGGTARNMNTVSKLATI